jgi:diadenosine tetraphosphate (Ap4A) HIT family hydrolase
MENLTSNPNSHLTANERESLSFPAKILLNQNLLIGDVLDFGCGFGSDIKMLKEQGLNIDGYDKYYFPLYPNKKFDTIICFYVLDILLPEEQASILMELSQLVKPTGKVYIAVRRDLEFEGFRIHEIHQKETYHCNVLLNSKSFFKNEDSEIYEYQHYNQIQKKENLDCIFCNPDSNRDLIVESEVSYAIYDKFPVNEGHALIIPKKHCDNYFDLTFIEQAACMFMLNKVKEIVSNKFNPDGFNIGINVGEKAGQTVNHVHIHLIPRYEGDVEDPKGGVRGVIPSKQKY